MTRAGVSRSVELVEQGTVAFWHGAEGWGAVRVPSRDGVGFVHFSQVNGSGFRQLVPGEPVEVEWGDDHEQDGCQWRVLWVRCTSRTNGGDQGPG